MIQNKLLPKLDLLRKFLYERKMGKHRNETLYFAYGANLNLKTMGIRCPTAMPLRTATIFEYKMIFNGPANIIKSVGDKVLGGLYSVTAMDIIALDRYEGVSHGAYSQIIFEDNGIEAFAYHMNMDGEFPPEDDYLEIVKQGYLDWGISDEQLIRALESSKRF